MSSENAPLTRILLGLLLITLACGGCATTSGSPDKRPGTALKKAAPDGPAPLQGPGAPPLPRAAKRATLSLYAMSKCPFAAEAEASMAQAYLELRRFVEFKINYIVNEQEGKFDALHGESEVQGNILQLCVQHHYPMEQVLPFILCQNKNMHQIPSGWEQCAQLAGLDQKKISACAASPLGPELLRDSMRASAKVNAMGSPTILINGAPYNGNRTKLAFMRGLCAQMKDSPPEPCLKIPSPPLVKLTILSDVRCKDCKTEELIDRLRERFFPNLVPTAVDYSSSAGRALYKEVGEQHLPLLLFQDGVKKAEMYD